MKNAILENIVRPVIARFGTALAAILLAYGFESHVAEPFVNALAAVVLLGVDLLLSRYYRKLAIFKRLAVYRGDDADETRGFGPVVGPK